MSDPYNVGTVTVANGATSVTGTDTFWVGKVRKNDMLFDPAQGLMARVTVDPTDNEVLTITAWPGTSLVAAAYEIIPAADTTTSSARLRDLLADMSVIEANGRGLFYLFSDSVTDADPGAGYLRLNNATIGSATAAYIDNLDANGATVSAVLDTWDDAGTSGGRGQLWLRSVADPASFHAFDVTGSVVDGTGYRKLTLEYVGGAGSFAADDELMASFLPTGDAGATGDAGVGGITLTFDSSTTDADPGAGEFRLNHATHASATAIYIDNVEALAGASITSLLDSWDDGQSTIKGTLTISSKAAPEIFRLYNVTGSVVDGTGYRKLTIAYVTGAGTLANTTSCSVQFARGGNAGFTPGFRLAFSTTTTDADPGAGIVRFNHATFASITELYVDNADQGGTTITAWLDSLDDVVNANARAYLRFENVDDPTIYAEFAVTGTVTDGTGYRKIPVSPIVGVVPANGVVLAVNAAKSGADGAGTGDVVGPASAVADRMAAFDGTTGKLIKDSGIPLTGLRDTSVGATLATARNLVVKWVSASTVDIDADRLELFDSSGNGQAFNAINLTADIATSGNNGRGTAIAETGNLWYYLFVGDGGGTPYCWLDTSATGANDPSASTYKGRVGAVRNDGSSNIKPFLQRGRAVALVKDQVLSLGTSTTAASIDLSAVVPPIAVSAEYEVQPSTSSGSADVTVALSSNASGTTPVTDHRALRAPAGTSASYFLSSGMVPIATAQTVYYWISGANGRANIYATAYDL